MRNVNDNVNSTRQQISTINPVTKISIDEILVKTLKVRKSLFIKTFSLTKFFQGPFYFTF